jgi:hypothetical protein
LESGLAAVTVLAVALDTPEDGSAHRIELATVVLRYANSGYVERGRLQCLLHAGMPSDLVAAHCGLPVDQVHDRTPAAVALSVLERHLTAPPYLLAAYRAGQLATLVDKHRGACPTLAATPILDVARLGRHMLPDPPKRSLVDLAGALAIPRPPAISRTAQNAALTAAVYQVLLAAVPGWQPLDLPALLQLGGGQGETGTTKWPRPVPTTAPPFSSVYPALRGRHA